VSHASDCKSGEEGLKSIRALQKDYMDKQYAQLTAKILLNEVVPRAKKLGVGFAEVCSPQDLSSLVTAEMYGINTRADTRKYLDKQGEK